MLFQGNPIVYQTQSPLFQPTAQAMNALYSSKMQPLSYDNIYYANCLNDLYRIRVSSQELIQWQYYMEALRYFIASPVPFSPFGNQTVIQPANSGDCSTPTALSYAQQTREEEKGNTLLDIFRECYRVKRVGVYDWETRVMKIIKYKIKHINKKNMKPVVTKYSGRSKVASLKARYRGRFIRAKQQAGDSEN